jgi:hypothetical protein
VLRRHDTHTSFMKIGSGIQNLIGGGGGTETDTHGQEGDPTSLLFFFQNVEYRIIRTSIQIDKEI